MVIFKRLLGLKLQEKWIHWWVVEGVKSCHKILFQQCMVGIISWMYPRGPLEWTRCSQPKRNNSLARCKVTRNMIAPDTEVSLGSPKKCYKQLPTSLFQEKASRQTWYQLALNFLRAKLQVSSMLNLTLYLEIRDVNMENLTFSTTMTNSKPIIITGTLHRK